MRFLLISAVLSFPTFWSGPAAAQTEFTTPAQQRAENRKALRDARRVPTEYKDSHLGVNRTAFRRGHSSYRPPKDGRQEYKFDNTGTPRVSEPMTVGLRLRRKTKEPRK